MASHQMIRLRSSIEGDIVELPRSAASSSSFVNDFFSSIQELPSGAATTGTNADTDATILEIPRSTTEGLRKVVEYLVHDDEDPMTPIEDPATCPVASSWEAAVPQAWYRSYVEQMELASVWKVRALANYMGIEQLSLLLNVWLTFQVAGSSLERIGDLLNIPPMTEEQLRVAREQEPWLFEDPAIVTNHTNEAGES